MSLLTLDPIAKERKQLKAALGKIPELRDRLKIIGAEAEQVRGKYNAGLVTGLAVQEVEQRYQMLAMQISRAEAGRNRLIATCPDEVLRDRRRSLLRNKGVLARRADGLKADLQTERERLARQTKQLESFREKSGGFLTVDQQRQLAADVEGMRKEQDSLEKLVGELAADIEAVQKQLDDLLRELDECRRKMIEA